MGRLVRAARSARRGTFFQLRIRALCYLRVDRVTQWARHFMSDAEVQFRPDGGKREEQKNSAKDCHGFVQVGDQRHIVGHLVQNDIGQFPPHKLERK